MSFLRHQEIYQSDVGGLLIRKLGAAWAAAPSTHRLDEFPLAIPWRVALQQSPPPLHQQDHCEGEFNAVQ